MNDSSIKKDNFSKIKEALEIMELPIFINMKDLKTSYKQLASLHHPDIGGHEEHMAKINRAYAILKNYMNNFKFSFSEEEIYKQFPEEAHVSKFGF